MKPQDVTKGAGKEAVFITLALNPGDIAPVRECIKDFCDRIPAVIRSIRLRMPEAGFDFVMGFGAQAWTRLFPNAPKPKELKPFEPIKGVKVDAVSTPGDLFFHLRANSMDVCFEMAQIIHGLLKDVTTSIDEVHGFRYLDGRAIIGFVDGTENPDADEAPEFAFIGEDDEPFTGCSYAFTQKYLHDMDAWNALSVEDQERAIGRRKFNDLEMDDEDKAKNAHTVISKAEDEDGEELKIIRANVVFARPTAGEYGTFFIGYAGTFSTVRQMLEQMFLGLPAGNYDRLLDFSTPVTGCLFFIPTYDVLEQIAAGELD